MQKFDYKSVQFDHLPCNLCSGKEFKTLSKKDRYGINTRTVICKNCGLIFLHPRMSAPDYDNFYNNAYRIMLEKYHRSIGENNSQNLDAIFESGRRRGKFLANLFGECLNAGTTLEVGSSYGGVLIGFRDILRIKCAQDFNILGIEPSQEEGEYADKKRGIHTKIDLFENFSDNLPKIENIIIARSLNHLLDPKNFFNWSYKTLSVGGHLIVMVLNFPAFCRHKGKIEAQIDHPFMFSESTLKKFVLVSGFQINSIVAKGNYLYLLAEKIGTANFQYNVSSLFAKPADYENTLRNLNPAKLLVGYYFKKFKTAIRHKIKP